MKKKADTSYKQISQGNKHDWSDKSLDDFFETLREQHVERDEAAT